MRVRAQQGQYKHRTCFTGYFDNLKHRITLKGCFVSIFIYNFGITLGCLAAPFTPSWIFLSSPVLYEYLRVLALWGPASILYSRRLLLVWGKRIGRSNYLHPSVLYGQHCEAPRPPHVRLPLSARICTTL